MTVHVLPPVSPAATAPTRLLLWHWGREGAGAKFTDALARHLHAHDDLAITICHANGSDLSRARLAEAGLACAGVPTFEGDKSSLRGKLAAMLGLVRLPEIAMRLRTILRRGRIDVAVCTFQSIWDIAALPVLARGPVRFILVLHDAFFHPGDGYPFRQYALRRQIGSADGLIVLSDHVASQAIAGYGFPADRIWKMPHGPFSFGSAAAVRAARHPRGSRPLSLLFLGRIVTYKGLDLLLQALLHLGQAGVPVQLVIAGAGSLAPYGNLLAQLPGVTTHNHWLSEDEIADLLAASDVVMLPYIEASQSGVAASAYAAGRPVVATPVGGLVEQVIPGQTGVIAAAVTPQALAAAIARFVEDPALLDHCATAALEHATGAMSWRRGAEVASEAVAAIRAAPRLRTIRRGHQFQTGKTAS